MERAAAYLAYIQSDEWRAVRKRYRDSKREWKCAVCGVSVNLHLHHRTYKRLGRERLSDLIPLCQFHHAETHRVERAGVQLWNAHSYVLVDKTVVPSEPRKWRKRQKKQKKAIKIIVPHKAKKRKADALQCTSCHRLYPERHNSLRCDCGGFVMYRKETAPRRLARRRHPAGK